MTNKADVQKLRELTGAGVMDSKNALVDADGDFDKAVELIKKRGVVKADKKADREVSAGIVDAYIHNNKTGSLVHVSCETDFVARSDIFKELAHDIAMQVAAMKPDSVDELMKQAYIKSENQTIEDLVKEAIAKLGENIKIEEVTYYES
jgi:elongation factor Ts